MLFKSEKGGGRVQEKNLTNWVYCIQYTANGSLNLERRTREYETKVFMHPDHCSISIRD